MNIQPGPAMLETLREQNLKWPIVLGELIDNAFDADAKRVQITFGGNKTIKVEDDGNGCDDIEAMLTVGRHLRQPTTRLGRYGVGLKDAACWMWGTLDIDTTHADKRRRFELCWADLVASGKWDLPEPLVTHADAHIGTALCFRSIRRGYPGDYDSLVNELRYLFTPGLLKGRQIVFQFQRRKQTVARPYEWPQLDNVVEAEIAVDGHSAKVRVGIVKDGEINERPGFAYCYHHRVILSGTALGSGGRSTSRVCGQVWLDDSWRLSKNKDDITLLQDELGEAVFAIARPVLERAERESLSLRSRAFNDRLSERFRAAIGQAAGQTKQHKEDRDEKQNATGRIEPRETGRERKRAKRKQPGDHILGAADNGQLRIDWKTMTGTVLGEVDFPGAVVWLNESNATLCAMRQSENESALLAICAGMYVNDALANRLIQNYLPGFSRSEHDDDRFPALWATLLSSLSASDGKPLAIAS